MRNETYESLIMNRTSVRNYDRNRPLTSSQITQIESILANFGTNQCRFLLVNETLSGVKLGTYGMISGAESYIVGIVGSTDKESIIEFGFRFEQIILELTRLELGTCWMAGTYNPSQFRSQITLIVTERIAIVSPVGFSANRDRFRDKLLQMVVKPRSRKPFDTLFFENSPENPLHESESGSYFPLLESVRQAPSASNKQPWRVIRDGRAFHFYTVREGVSTHNGIFFGWNDLGIAKAHFELVAKEKSICGTWEIVESTPLETMWEYCFSWIGE